MTAAHRPLVALCILILCAAGLALWSGRQSAHARDTAHRAVEQLTHVRQLSEQIKRLRHRPVVAGVQEMELTDLARLIEQAADQAAIRRQHLDRIWPENRRRIGESNYQQKPTQVLLRGVTLEQLTRFLHALAATEQGLAISSLRLVAPREAAEAGETWTAEITISYLIYAPREPQGAHVFVHEGRSRP